MSENTESFEVESTVTSPQTERYIRIHADRTQKGWRYDTTISIRTNDKNLHLGRELQDLHETARAEAKNEIAIREAEG